MQKPALLVSLIVLAVACSQSPETVTSPRKSPIKKGADAGRDTGDSDREESSDEEEGEETSDSDDSETDGDDKNPTENSGDVKNGGGSTPSTPETKPSVPDPTPMTPKPDPIPVPDPKPPAVNTPPSGCTGESSVSTADVVLYDGESKEVKNNAIVLSADWTFNDSWGNGKIGIEKKGDRSVVTFTGETIYNGFKITPAKVGNKRKTFVAKSVDIYVSSSKAAQATFGLRIIKPNEDEGNGAAPTTSWYKLMKDSQEADNKMIPAPITQDCKLVTYHIGKTFLDQNKISDRLIWEMMTNWNPADKVYIHRIVLKDFSWK